MRNFLIHKNFTRVYRKFTNHCQLFINELFTYSSKFFDVPCLPVIFVYNRLRTFEIFDMELPVIIAISEGIKPNFTSIVISNSN